MSLVLGLDGKRRAVQVNTGASPATITTFYVGLLSVLPTDYDGLTLEELVSTIGTEHTPAVDWYTGGRQAVTFEDPPSTVDALGALSYNTSLVSWDNTSGITQSVPGIFVTDAPSGFGGASEVLWVGPSDIGSVDIEDGYPATIDIGGMLCKVD